MDDINDPDNPNQASGPMTNPDDPILRHVHGDGSEMLHGLAEEIIGFATQISELAKEAKYHTLIRALTDIKEGEPPILCCISQMVGFARQEVKDTDEFGTPYPDEVLIKLV
jgi:hypothetical protein